MLNSLQDNPEDNNRALRSQLLRRDACESCFRENSLAHHAKINAESAAQIFEGTGHLEIILTVYAGNARLFCLEGGFESPLALSVASATNPHEYIAVSKNSYIPNIVSPPGQLLSLLSLLVLTCLALWR